MRSAIPRAFWCLVVVAVVWSGTRPAPAQTARPRGGVAAPTVPTISDGFESAKLAWRLEKTDATVKIYAQERTERAAHEGVQSEGFSFDAGVGGGFYYSYALPRIPVRDDLRVTMYVRSNRAGAYLIGRVILPADVDPETRRPSFVQVQSTSYEASDRWQRIEMSDFLPEIERQARVIRASTQRRVSTEGAYLERLVVNLYGGEGETEVYLDELKIGPVPPEVAESWTPTTRTPAPRSQPSAVAISDRSAPAEPGAEPLPPLPTSARVRFDGNRLTRDGYPWFFTGVRGPGLNPTEVHKAGFDLLFLPHDADESVTQNAVRSGLMLVPDLVGAAGRDGDADPAALDPDQILSSAATFSGRDAVAFWMLGQGLGRDLELDRREAVLKRTRDTIRGLRRNRPAGIHLATATVQGFTPEYARLPENLDMVGVEMNNWATVQNPLETLDYLNQRRILTARSNPNALLWANFDATPPPIYREAVWGTDRPPGWGMPRVQPEQLRINTYLAMSAGYRGLCINADASLTEADGRSNLIELTLLNLETDLIQSILADADKEVQILDTFPPDAPPPLPPPVMGMNTSTMKVQTPKEGKPHGSIRAAAIETKDRRGRLLLLADYAPYTQYQPPMAAINKLSVVVPASPDSIAYEINPGGITVRDTERVPGGIKITLPDFGVSAILLITTNADLVRQIQMSVERNRPVAVALAIEQAERQKAWVEEINAEIANGAAHHTERDSAELIAQSGEMIQTARARYEALDYQAAWDEARRAGRPLRYLQRFHFLAVYDRIIKSLKDEDLPCGPIRLAGKDKPQERIVQPIVSPALASWSTLPQAWVWSDWIQRGRLGGNRLPSGDFEFPDEELMAERGWSDESYDNPDITRSIKVNKGGADKRGHHLTLMSTPRPEIPTNSLVPFLDHPVVAVRTPGIKVKAQEIYRISFKIDMTYPTNPGAGGLIVRDSIGGERLQFRLTSAAQSYFEVVFYRRVPAETTLSVLIGLAGYGRVNIDDFKVEPIQETVDLDTYAQSRPRRATTRSATTTTTTDEKPTTRSATRAQPYPIRQ